MGVCYQVLLYLKLYLLCVRIGEISRGSNRTHVEGEQNYYQFVSLRVHIYFLSNLICCIECTRNPLVHVMYYTHIDCPRDQRARFGHFSKKLVL